MTEFENLPLKPCGTYVLVKMMTIKAETASGIVVKSDEQVKREQAGCDICMVLAFGPKAFKSLEGVEKPEDWGVRIGGVYELTARYEGKDVRIAELNRRYEQYKLVPDTVLIGEIVGDAREMIGDIK